MSGRTPRPRADMARGPAMPAPEPADYSDELSNEQIDVLRKVATQDETKMGALVHEFVWRR